jgi:arylformamidase
MKQLWDISPPLQANTPVFPGDTAYQQHWSATLGPDCPVNVSAITLSPHAGAHADAPLHYDPNGDPAGQLDLEPYLGPCRVIHAIGCGPLVRLEHLQHRLDAVPPRVLVRMYQHMPQDHFDTALPAFAPETIEF